MKVLKILDEIITDLDIDISNNSMNLPNDFSETILFQSNKNFIINIGKNSNVVILENNNSKVHDLLINIDENSHLNYNLVDLENNINSKREFNVNKNARIDGIIGYFNGGKANNTKVNVNLLGEMAYANIKSVAIGLGTNMKIDININHLAKYTTGLNENYAVSNTSTIIYNVVGKIENKMEESKSSQKTRGIILSKNAKIEANPALLIDEYNVAANHGACIGKISDEGLFYLMSRGITKEDALKLIVNGFLNPIYELLADPDFKTEFVNAAKLKLE